MGGAQKVDYKYNERDWLTQINELQFGETQGGEGGFPADKFAMMLGYHNISQIGSQQGAQKQYNGNISWIGYDMPGVNFTDTYGTTSQVGYTFGYDAASRLTKADFGYYATGWRTTQKFDAEKFTYDKAGNIDSLLRRGSNGGMMDVFKYNYVANTNKLVYIKDTVATGSYSTDVDDQTTSNYAYDGNGNTAQDLGSRIGFVIYDMYNLPVGVYRTDGQIFSFSYDAAGWRIKKEALSGWPANYVIGKDGQTEVIAPYSTTATYNILGNDNLGQLKRTSSTWSRYYYLKDHLGSVRVTVDASGSVASWDDYYPFGMQMEGRSSVSGGVDARYKFTAKERDTETGYDYFGARYYDARIGRWLSIDPLGSKYPNLTPFAYSNNSPLVFVDPNGREFWFAPSTTNNTYLSAAFDLVGETEIGGEILRTLEEPNFLVIIAMRDNIEGAYADTYLDGYQPENEIESYEGERIRPTSGQTRPVFVVTFDKADLTKRSLLESSHTVFHELWTHILFDRTHSGFGQDHSGGVIKPGSPADKFQKEAKDVIKGKKKGRTSEGSKASRIEPTKCPYSTKHLSKQDKDEDHPSGWGAEFGSPPR